MPTPLMATKLFIPPPGKSLVDRPRLISKLDECLEPGCRLALVSAPAGFGKTTLVSTWIHHIELSAAPARVEFAWLTLDEGDNDPLLFWLYAISSLGVHREEIGQQTKSLLQLPNPPDIETALAILINDLAQVPNPLILILDDFHRVRYPAIHKSLSFFVDHLPAQFHVIVVSRTDPPLPLALLRSRHQLVEIHMTDLRFTQEEAATFITRVMQVVLNYQEIGALNQRTEGWIAGLQMAAISMKTTADLLTFISEFSGNDRYIADFLIEEVLEGQSEETQRFLLKTSILDHLQAPLCQAVTDYQKSQEMLNTLEKANLFISPLDNRREWFRYHQLFSDLLKHKLINMYSEKEVRELEHRAVDWLAKNGYPQMAIEYAVKYADYDLAASLLTDHGSQLIKESAFITLLSLAERIPEPLITQNITLSCLLTHSAMATGRMQLADHLIQNVEKHVGVTIIEFIQKGDLLNLPPLVEAGLIELGVFQARTSVDTFHIDRTFYLAEHLLPYLTRDRDVEPFALNPRASLRASLLYTLGLAHMMHGDVSRAAQIFVESANEGKQTHNLDLEILSLGHLGDALLLQGRLHEAEKTFEQTLMAPEEILNKTPFFRISKAGLGNIFYEWNELEKAEQYYQAAIEKGQWWRNWENLLPGYTGLTHIHTILGDWEAAYADLDGLLSNVQEKEGIVQGSVEATRALVNLRRGNIDAAERWADAYEPERSCDYMVEWEEDALVACRVWSLRGQTGRADKLLERIIAEAEAAGRNKIVLEALCIRATMYASMHKKTEAMAVLAKCLVMGKPENYIRTFLDEGQAMSRLLSEAVRSGIQTEYASRLLQAFSPSTAPVAGRAPHEMLPYLVEPLTVREIEVLRLISEGYPNKEIAQKLHISLRTVKYHTTNIYTKLNVSGRAHAVAKARNLELI